MVILPVPSRKRTRATDFLRRPVLTHSCFLVLVSAIVRSCMGSAWLELDGLLRLVVVRRPGEHLELGHLLPAEPIAWHHALDRLGDDALGVLFEHLLGCHHPEAAGVMAVRSVGLRFPLPAGEAH